MTPEKFAKLIEQLERDERRLRKSFYKWDNTRSKLKRAEKLEDKKLLTFHPGEPQLAFDDPLPKEKGA